MSFDVSALTAYVNQESTNLILPLHFEGNTFANVTPMGGVKYKEALQLFEVDAIPQDGANCGFEATGDSTFTQRDMEVKKIKYQMSWCMDDLRTYWTQKLLVPGASEEDRQLTFQQSIIDDVLGQIMENNDYADWQGNTGSSDSILQRYDGFLKVIDDAGTAIDGNTSALSSITTGSSGNADTICYEIADARPARLKGRGKRFLIFMGTDTFDKVVDTMIQKNNYHIDRTGQDDSYTMDLPGRRGVTLVGTGGLDGTDRLVGAMQENLFIGFDLANDYEQFYFHYEELEEQIYCSIKYKRGTQIARVGDVVDWQTA